jgi:hypothetical protein
LLFTSGRDSARILRNLARRAADRFLVDVRNHAREVAQLSLRRSFRVFESVPAQRQSFIVASFLFYCMPDTGQAVAQFGANTVSLASIRAAPLSFTEPALSSQRAGWPDPSISAGPRKDDRFERLFNKNNGLIF